MNRPVSVVAVVLVVLCVAGLGVPTAMAGTGAASDPSPYAQSTAPTETQSQSAVAQSQDFDQTTFEITVHQNGSATWTIRHERRFEGENASEEQDAFEEFAEEFESEESDLYQRFINSSKAMAAGGAEQTDREMAATNFRRSARVEEQLGTTHGIVEMSFTWEGFARVDGGTVTVGDVFEDLYIADDQVIEVEAGDGLTFDRVDPEADAQYAGNSLENADTVRWSGEQQFLDGQPRAVFVRDGVAEGSAVTWQLAAAGLLALAVVVGAVWYHRRRTDDDDGPTPDAVAEPDDSEASAPAAAAATAATTERDVDDGPSEREAQSEPNPLTDEELLTDEDRVVKLIRENGGRMKQVNIVEETGWSKSKVSMLLSDMEEDGTISKLRVGRENIISLDGFEPEATKSPFEE
ncbi:Uncharacterized membrane-associated protein/domain-like protein [Haloterrigena turkmenica DSM 5511]|uniref:Uncharacterized membrane-associated protein/domain-like protein n=1 Tax=Haloterrigena turkmenica (strain ATCC 51198 / DSM 5511 / JCM 9101 / NCIMB 13204 / VKM B-1734 / 4k) TaxID=543526 RepID=D2RVW0_HALTV|nr:membrane protein [Haloterrigena turkmenica]ADB61389.1 Uncharacterized membrane-associated protein/domain-like protein [Haloterrigena turkmenica DSM 5511]